MRMNTLLVCLRTEAVESSSQAVAAAPLRHPPLLVIVRCAKGYKEKHGGPRQRGKEPTPPRRGGLATRRRGRDPPVRLP